MIELILDIREPLECLTIYTPLGIRFWDPAQDVQVTDGLSVIAHPEGRSQPAAHAFRTHSGVYAFRGLPGLRDIEYPTRDSGALASPPTPFRFFVSVTDQRRRFLPVVFGVDVPHEGIYLTSVLGSPPGNGLPGFYLFSAPTRTGEPALAVVRAQLEERVDALTRRVAAHAVLEVKVPGPKTWYGVSDTRGSVAVLFPYPTFTGTSGAASPLTSPVEVGRQHWDLNVRVRYEPTALAYPNGSTIPDLRSIFAQSDGVLWSTLTAAAGQPVGEMSAELSFGQELVMRTDHEPALLIGSVS